MSLASLSRRCVCRGPAPVTEPPLQMPLDPKGKSHRSINHILETFYWARRGGWSFSVQSAIREVAKNTQLEQFAVGGFREEALRG